LNGLTITGGLFRTASTGQRIEISSSDVNKINFFDGITSTRYGSLEVYNDGADGYIRLTTEDVNANLELLSSVTVAGYTAAILSSKGGEFNTNGSNTNGFVDVIGKYGDIGLRISCSGGAIGNGFLELTGEYGYGLTIERNGMTSYDIIRADCVFATTSSVSFRETGGGTASVAVIAPADVDGFGYTLYLPPNAGTNTYVLTTDGSGNTSWTAPASTGANTALSNLSSVAINTSLISDANNTDDLGSTGTRWRSGYFGTSVYVSDSVLPQKVLIDTGSSGRLRIPVGTDMY